MPNPTKLRQEINAARALKQSGVDGTKPQIKNSNHDKAQANKLAKGYGYVGPNKYSWEVCLLNLTD